MQRLCNYKIKFFEDDIRNWNGLDLIYLDPTKDYPVPDITQEIDGGYHWPRKHREISLMVGNALENNPHMAGGLLPRIRETEKAIILGSGTLEYKLIEQAEEEVIFGVGRSSTQDHASMDYYLCNSPYEEAMNWLPEKSISGIFSFSIFPEFVKSYRGLKFFYGSGWEPLDAHLYLIDLIDPISALLSLLMRTQCQKILLVNPFFKYEEERQGTVQVGDYFMYPQQIMSLALTNALIFWIRRSGRDIYILGNTDSQVSESFKSKFEEENYAR